MMMGRWGIAEEPRNRGDAKLIESESRQSLFGFGGVPVASEFGERSRLLANDEEVTRPLPFDAGYDVLTTEGVSDHALQKGTDLLHVINFDEIDAGAALLSGQHGGVKTRQ